MISSRPRRAAAAGPPEPRAAPGAPGAPRAGLGGLLGRLLARAPRRVRSEWLEAVAERDEALAAELYLALERADACAARWPGAGPG